METKEKKVEFKAEKKVVEKKPVQHKVERSIRIFAFEQNERTKPQPYPPPKTERGKFLTGQQDVLSEANMRGDVAITEAQATALYVTVGDAFIINPDRQYVLLNGRTFDLSHMVDEDGKIIRYLNAKDYAEFTFFTSQPEVLLDKSRYNRFKHLHYVEDKEADSRITNHNRTVEFEAEAFIRSEMTIKRLKDLALLLSHLIKGVKIDPDTLSMVQLEDKLFSICKKHPNDVLLCKGAGAKESDLHSEKLFALKAIKTGEIVLSEGNYYYGTTKQHYIGDSFESLLLWLRDVNHGEYVSRIGNVVKEYDEKAID